VPVPTIMEDYEASNYYRKTDNNRMIQMISSMGINANVAASMVMVKTSFLQATFNKIIIQYGSIDTFLEKELGIGAKEKAILQSKYVE
jgi:protein-tyrosine phosphatase